MKPSNRKATSPGEVLITEFIKPFGMAMVATKLGITLREVLNIADGTQPITADIANTLAKGLGTTPEFWMNLQTAYEDQQ